MGDACKKASPMTVCDFEKELKSRDELITKLSALVDELRAELKWQKAKYEALERRVFGTSSERLTQADLSNFLPALADVPGNVYKAPEIVPTELTSRTKQPLEKAGGLRTHIPEHVEKVDIEMIPAEVQADPGSYKKIGEEVTQRLDYVPGKIICKRYIQPKYKDIRASGTILQQSPPPTVIDKCLAEPGLVAHILMQKYEMHSPYYRQSKQFSEKYAVHLHRNLLGDWGLAGAIALEPIYDAMIRHVQKADYLQVDETPVKYQDPEIEGKTGTGQLWVYEIPRGEVVFAWKTDRSRQGPEALLKTFQGYLQTDAYSVYDSLEKKRPDLTFVACMAHVRRKFFAAKDDDKEALWFLDKIGKLYELESVLREQKAPPLAREQVRQEHAIPILKEIKIELDKALPLIVPKSHFGKAISYAHKLWSKLEIYTTNGILEIDNNLCENSIRPSCLGKKNWLFFGSPTAGDRGALLYSLIGSCRRLGINPHHYLADVLARLPGLKIKSIDEIEPLTPSGWLRTRN